MVKGISRRVVIVQPADRELFEQAIFLVRDHTAPRSEVVREACRIAERCLPGRRVSRRRFSGRHVLAAFLTGLVMASLLWTVILLLV